MAEIHSENLQKEESIKQSEPGKILQNFPYFAVTSFLYGIFFTFCLYRNLTGILFPVWVVGTILYFIFAFSKLELKWKKSSWVFATAIFLLAVSTCLTDDGFLHFFNALGILLLMATMLLHQLYQDRDWGFGRYFLNMWAFFANFLCSLILPFRHLDEYRKKQSAKEHRMAKYIGLGILVAIPLILVVLALLVSADEIFSHMVGNLLLPILENWDWILIICLICVMTIVIYAVMGGLINYPLSEKQVEYRKTDPVIAITFTSVLALIYLLFCGIQIVYLFAGGSGGLPDGFTYAEYARKGFFQLLLVSILNFAIVIICSSFFRDSRILKGILTLISICNYVLIGSSVYRMILYVKAYNLTYLRILVLWFLGVLSILMIGVLIYIYRRKFRLFLYLTMVITIGYLGFSFSRPDARIAVYNIENKEVLLTEDVSYLMRNLSLDAAPVIARLNPDEIKGASTQIYEDDTLENQERKRLEFYVYFEWVGKHHDSSFRKYNFSVERAVDTAADYLEKHAADKKIKEKYQGYPESQSSRIL